MNMSTEEKMENEKEEKIMTYQDAHDFCKNMDIPLLDFRIFFGYDLETKNPKKVITNKSLRYLIKLLTLYPYLNPFKKPVSFKEIEDFFTSYLPMINFIHPKIFPQLIGAHVLTYRNLKSLKQEPTKPMVAIFDLVRRKLLAEGIDGMQDLIKLSMSVEDEQKNMKKVQKRESEEGSRVTSSG